MGYNVTILSIKPCLHGWLKLCWTWCVTNEFTLYFTHFILLRKSISYKIFGGSSVLDIRFVIGIKIRLQNKWSSTYSYFEIIYLLLSILTKFERLYLLTINIYLLFIFIGDI